VLDRLLGALGEGFIFFQGLKASRSPSDGLTISWWALIQNKRVIALSDHTSSIRW
jgi:hypothetical protein